MPEQTIQPAAAAGIDTTIKSDAAATNFGANADLLVYTTAGGANRDALLKFDLSAISKGSKIQAATLSVYVNANLSVAFDRTVARIMPANINWTEGGATWNTMDGAAAWVGGVGCEVLGVDIDGGYLFTDAGPWVNAAYNDFVLAPSGVQAMIDQGNAGFKIFSKSRTPTADRGVNLSSSDHGTAAQHPKLFVRWIEPSGRLFQYKFNKYDADKKIYDSTGNEVQPDEIRPDNWIFTEGFDLPSGVAYDSLITDPRMSYIVGVNFDEDGNVLGIETDRNQFADAIIQRLTRGV